MIVSGEVLVSLASLLASTTASRKLQGVDVSVLLVFWQNWATRGRPDASNGTAGSSVRFTKYVPVRRVPAGGAAAMVKVTPLLVALPTLTRTFPLVVHGTGATILVLVQLEGVVAMPLKVTVFPV